MRVALLAEGVDRNKKLAHSQKNFTVALLAEGVDRNSLYGLANAVTRHVALLAEGVDRNPLARTAVLAALGRPPRGGRG